MQVRRNSRPTESALRLLRQKPLQLELLEGRLPPGDLGLTGAFVLGDWTPELSSAERRTAAPHRLFDLGSDLTPSGRLELLNTLSALPAEYAATATAPVAGAAATITDGGAGDPLFEVASTFGFQDGPGVTDVTMGVGPNVLANSRRTCATPGQGMTQSEVS